VWSVSASSAGEPVSAAAVPFAMAIVVFAASAARTLLKLSSELVGPGADTLTVHAARQTPVPLSVGTSRRNPGVRTRRSGRNGDDGST